MPSVDREKRERLLKAIGASIDANSQMCAQCLDISLMDDSGEVGEAFKNLATMCATNVKVFRITANALSDAWGIIDFRSEIDGL